MYMKTVTMHDLRAHLKQHLDEVTDTHEVITITRHGSASAVLVSADDWESIEETLYWLQPEHSADIEQARAELAHGEGVPLDEAFPKQVAAIRAEGK